MFLALVLHLFLAGRPRSIVASAIEGAARRLSRPACQQLFTEFADADGRSLADVLHERGETPETALSELYFAEGAGSPQCRNRSMTAFTQPHSRVVYVCGDRFADSFARKTIGGEMLIIHELLHSLGLGENPPTSAQITDRVWSRCGK